jgi:hypothetical protein
MRGWFLIGRGAGGVRSVPAQQCDASSRREIDARRLRVEHRDEPRVHQGEPERREGRDRDHAEAAVGHRTQPDQDGAKFQQLLETSNFSRTVRRWFGATPRELREPGRAAPRS